MKAGRSKGEQRVAYSLQGKNIVPIEQSNLAPHVPPPRLSIPLPFTCLYATKLFPGLHLKCSKNLLTGYLLGPTGARGSKPSDHSWPSLLSSHVPQDPSEALSTPCLSHKVRPHGLHLLTQPKSQDNNQLQPYGCVCVCVSFQRLTLKGITTQKSHFHQSQAMKRH